MLTLWQDLRFGIRMLKKNPGFTAVAGVERWAVGHWLKTQVVFSGLLNGLILRPLNVPHAEGLYLLEHGKRQIPELLVSRLS